MDNVKLEVLTPVGATEAKRTAAPRIPDLQGKTICELSNGPSYRTTDTFPVIRELLQARFPGTRFITYETFGNYHPHDIKKIGKQVKAAGCDALIAGNGG